MSSIGLRTFTNALTDARELLNDAGSDWATDAALLPLANQIYAEIQAEFASRQLPFIETTSTSLTYAANATSIVIPGGITDLQEPLELWERQTTGDGWDLIERATLGPASPTAPDTIGQWEWNEGIIKVNPCSRARLILCRYRRTFPYISSAALPMGGVASTAQEHVYWSLVFGTAWLAAISREHSEMKINRFERQYRKRMSDSIFTVTHDLAGIPNRQEGYRADSGPAVVIHVTS